MLGAERAQRRRLGAAASVANGQRGAKRQPAAARSGLGTVPSIVASRSRSSSRRGIEPSRPLRVGMLRVARTARRPAPARRSCRRTSPAPSAISATTPRSWVMIRIAMPSSPLQVLQQVEDLRLDGDVERGGRLVGDQQLRARRRAPWRSSRAGACRRTAGADSRRAPLAATGMPHQLQHLDGASRAPPAATTADVRQDRLDDLVAEVKTGLSEVIGSWKIIDDRGCRAARASLVGQRLSRSRPSNSTDRRRDRAGGLGTRPMIESAVTLLPQPDSPTSPTVLPRPTAKSMPSTARNRPRSV